MTDLSDLTNEERAELLDKIFSRTAQRANGCIEWLGGCNGKGYGTIQWEAKNLKKLKVHRVVFELTKGPIRPGARLTWSCGNRSCLNENHIILNVYRDEDLRRDFLANIVEENGPLETPCWIWQRSFSSSGYGVSIWRGRHEDAHRVSHRLWCGPIPEGKQLNHFCHNPKCVNYLHTYTGSKADNKRDEIEAGRHAHGERHGFAKLDDAKLTEAFRLNAEGKTNREIGELLGVTAKTIGQLLRDQTWRHRKRPDGYVYVPFRSAKLTSADIPGIWQRIREGQSDDEIAEHYKVTASAIRSTRLGFNWINFRPDDYAQFKGRGRLAKAEIRDEAPLTKKPWHRPVIEDVTHLYSPAEIAKLSGDTPKPSMRRF